MSFQIRFDGPPGQECGRFVECETLDGKSIRVGRWKQDGADWLLIIDDSAQLALMKLANEALLGRINRALELVKRGYACAPLILQALNGEQKP